MTRGRTGAAAVAFLLLAGCAADGTRVVEPRAVYTADDGSGARILLVETQRLVRVFSPEGLKSTVSSFDLDYVLEDAGGRRTPLPFLDVRDASRLDDLNHVLRDPGRDAWVGIGVRSTDHARHVSGLQWEYVVDDFVAMRVKAFTRERLLAKRDLEVCNPVFPANPTIRFVAASHVLRYCTKAGIAEYDPSTGREHLLDREPCCPAAGQTSGRGRVERGFVVVEAP